MPKHSAPLTSYCSLSTTSTMPPHYSPSTEYIALFLSLPVVFYLGSISTYSKFTAFKLCPLPSTKAETKATPPLPPAKTIRSNGLRTVAIQCATWVVMFVGMRKIPANVWDTLLLGFMWFFLVSYLSCSSSSCDLVFANTGGCCILRHLLTDRASDGKWRRWRKLPRVVSTLTYPSSLQHPT